MKKILLVVAMLALYLAISEMSAKKKAQNFCDSVSIGDITNDLQEKGIASGARSKGTHWLDLGDSTRQIDITYTGFYPGSDFICRIREKSGAVIAKNPNIIRSLF